MSTWDLAEDALARDVGETADGNDDAGTTGLVLHHQGDTFRERGNPGPVRVEVQPPPGEATVRVVIAGHQIREVPVEVGVVGVDLGPELHEVEPAVAPHQRIERPRDLLDPPAQRPARWWCLTARPTPPPWRSGATAVTCEWRDGTTLEALTNPKLPPTRAFPSNAPLT